MRDGDFARMERKRHMKNVKQEEAAEQERRHGAPGGRKEPGMKNEDYIKMSPLRRRQTRRTRGAHVQAAVRIAVVLAGFVALSLLIWTVRP